MVALPLATLGVVEGALRVLGFGCETGFLIRFGDQFTSNDRFGWLFFPKPLATSPYPFQVPANKPAGTYRIVVLGESAAEGTPDASFNFGRMLEAMLRLQFPQRRFEVVNAAMTAINSHAIRLIAEDCRQLQPDLVVIYMGNNEVIGPFGLNSAGRPLPGWLIRASLWLRSFRVGQLMQNAMGSVMRTGDQPASWQGMEMFLNHQVSADDPKLAAVYDHFRANLRAICATAQSAGAKVIVATVATNLADNPPFASVHRAGFAGADKNRWTAFFQAGIAEQSAGHDAAALENYRQAAQLDGGYAELRFRMADCLRRLHQDGEARALYSQARDLDALRFRADSRINDIIRQEAAGREPDGVRLADAARAFEESEWVEPHSPGDALFYEHVHLTARGNFMLARSIRSQMSDFPVADVPAPSACAELIALTEPDEFRMVASMTDMTARPPFVNQFDHGQRQARRVERVDGLRATLPAAFERARLTYETAIGRSPDDWRLRDNFARLLMERGEFAAAAALWESLLPQVPSDGLLAAEWSLNLGEAVGRLGRFDEAMVWFQRAAKSWRDVPNTHRGIGEILIARQQYGEAAAEFCHAIRLNPNHVPAINGLGMVKFKTNDFAAAAVEFTRALGLQQSAILHLNLAAALDKLGKFDEAVVHYREALNANPQDAHTAMRLATAMARSSAARGHDGEAAQHYWQALQAERDVGVALELAWLLVTSKDDRVRNAAEAIALAEPFCRPPGPASTQAQDVLAAAYAEAGRFTEACDLASAAERKAREVGDTKLTREILARRVLYQAGKPCRAP